MRTQLSPVHTDLPPPARYLLHDERPVAWLSGNRFGFSGFADPTEAANAAWVAFRTISRKLAPVLGVRPSPIDIEPLRIEWRDGAETIFASHRPIAALVRPDADAPSAPRWFGFTIEVPPEIGGRQLRGAVHAAHRALLKSGVGWSMIRPRRGYRACAAQVRPARYDPLHHDPGARPSRTTPGPPRGRPEHASTRGARGRGSEAAADARQAPFSADRTRSGQDRVTFNDGAFSCRNSRSILVGTASKMLPMRSTALRSTASRPAIHPTGAAFAPARPFTRSVPSKS